MTQNLVKPKRSHSFLLKLGLIIAVFVFVAVIGLNKFKGAMIAQAIANAPETATPVTAMTVSYRDYTPVIETTGTIRPNQGSMLSTQTSGTVTKINIKSGQVVRKGDVLVELDDSVEVASLKAMEAQIPAARLTYQRYSKLLQSQSVSQTEFDNAKATYEQLVANANSLRASVERRKILAPFDGVTGIVKINEGQYVNAGTEIVRVEDVTSMKVDFSVSQNELENLYVGQKVTATTDARVGETFAAKVTAIEPAVNKSTGLIELQATFEPEDGKKLLSGMFARLRLALPTQHEQIVVPQVAITYNMYGETAYILQPLSEEEREAKAEDTNLEKMYRVKQTTVFTKDRQGIYALLSGDEIKAGDKIVTGGQQNLTNGALVIVADKEGVGTVQPASKTNL